MESACFKTLADENQCQPGKHTPLCDPVLNSQPLLWHVAANATATAPQEYH